MGGVNLSSDARYALTHAPGAGSKVYGDIVLTRRIDERAAERRAAVLGLGIGERLESGVALLLLILLLLLVLL